MLKTGRYDYWLRLAAVAVLLAAVYWLLEAAADSLFLNVSFFNRLFTFEPHEVWQRFFILTLLLVFAWYANSIFTQKQRVQKELGKTRGELEHTRSELELYKFLVDNSAVAILWVNEKGQIKYANEALCRERGYSREELEGKEIGYLDPGYGQAVWPEHWERIKSEGALRFESYHKKKDGQKFPVEVSVSYLESGEQEYGFAVVQNISERREFELELENLAKFAAENPQPILRIGRDGIVMFANPAGARLLELSGGSVGEKAPEYLGRAAGEAINSGERLERVIEQEDRVFSFFVVPIGERQYCNFYGREITAERAAQAQLNILEFAINHANDEIYLMDENGKFKFVNDSACKKLGYSREELLKMDVFGIDPVLTREQWVAAWSRLKKEKTVTLGSVHRGRDGTDYPIDVSANIIDYKGRLFDFAFCRDITEQRRAEREIRTAAKELSDKNKELESIIYIASHDLRSALVNIQGFSKELNMACDYLHSMLTNKKVEIPEKERIAKTVGEDVPESLGFILTSTARIDTLISGLLKISRIGTEAMTIEKINTKQLTAEVLARMEFELRHNNIRVEVGDLPECKGDETMIRQVMTNLVDNAVKFMDRSKRGLIRITGSQERDGVKYCVIDNGIGIAKEHQGKVFEVFHRLHPEKTEGEGLGLSIARRIVERHNGRIWVTSETGKGSSFCFMINRPDGAQ